MYICMHKSKQKYKHNDDKPAKADVDTELKVSSVCLVGYDYAITKCPYEILLQLHKF